MHFAGGVVPPYSFDGAALPHLVRRRVEVGAQALNPLVEGKSEALFVAAVADYGWQNVMERGAEHRFRAFSAPFELGWQPKRIFYQLMIKEWHAHFERVRHAHHVGVA